MNRRREALRPVFGNPKFINAMVRLTNSSADYDVSDQLDKITAPTLVVSCEEDYLIPMAEQRFLVERIPDCHYVVIPNCGHASMYEQPTLFASLTLGFFNNPKLKYNIV